MRTTPRVPAVVAMACMAIALTAGCGGSSSSSVTPAGSSPAPRPSASEPSPALPSIQANELRVGGSRPTLVDLPAGNGVEPAPLVVLLHGYGSTGVDHESYFRLAPTAAERGFVYAHPDGTVDRDGQRFWNATDACCDFESTGVDDLSYLAGLVSEIDARRPIDPKRIYFVGHSNGGFMSYRMACEHADFVAAIVSLASATFAKRADCAPSGPVAVLEIHGTADDVVEFRGGRLSDFGAPGDKAAYPGVNATVASWEAYDGCATTATRSAMALDIDAQMNGATGPAETTVDTWADCAPGGHVELWTIRGGHHSPDLTPLFADALFDFLAAHPKP